MNSDKLKWKYNGCVWMADASSHKDQYVIRRLVNAMIDTEAITFEVGHQTTERRPNQRATGIGVADPQGSQGLRTSPQRLPTKHNKHLARS